MRPGRLHPFGLEAVGDEDDRHVRMQLPHPLDEALGALGLAGHERIVDEDIRLGGHLAGVPGEDGAADPDRAHALPRVVAAAAEGIHFLVGEVDVVMNHEDARHGSLLGRQRGQDRRSRSPAADSAEWPESGPGGGAPTGRSLTIEHVFGRMRRKAGKEHA